MRPDLIALTPQSIAALANLGLVKRAQKEIEAGKGPEIDEEDGDVVIGRFEDGVVTKLPPGVTLRDAPCSCGATTVCRHRVAVALAYPAWAAGPGSKRVEAWSPECFTDDDLLAVVGKRIMTRAQALVREGIVVELTGGAQPLAKLPTCAVRFHVPRDLAYARCDCQVAQACEHVVIAAWAFRKANEGTIELGTKAEGALDVAHLISLSEHVLSEGVAHLSEAEKARFALVRKTLDDDGLLWPSVILDELEILLEGYRARSARYRTSEAAFLLTSLAARLRAVERGGELPRRFLLGSDEARDTLLDHVRLVSLGARVSADGDRRDVRIYLADPDSGTVLVMEKEFLPDPKKKTVPGEGPELAKKTIAGRTSVGTLARGQVVTKAAQRRANHTISLGTTRQGQTSVAPSTGDFSSLPAGLLVADLTTLAEDLAKRPPRVLRPRTLASQMKVIALPPDAVTEIAYRPGEQEVVASVTIGEASFEVVRRHSRAAPHALDAIAKALKEAPRYIAGEVHRGRRGLELDPTAIVTDRIIVPDLETEPAIVEGLPRYGTAGAHPIDHALSLASSLLEEALHDGLSHLRPGFAERAQQTAAALGDVGLTVAKDRVVELGESKTPAAWLNASLRIELTRELL